MTTAQLQQKSFSVDMTCEPGERCFVAKITSDAVDRDREVLLPDGMDATDFEKNPVVFLGHDYSQLPVGKVVSLKRNGDHWLAKVQMADRPDDHDGEWIPDTIFSLVKQGVIRGVSVGFQVTASPRVPTKADKEKFGEDVNAVIPRWKLMELSIAPLPCNQDALIEAVSKGVKAGSIERDTATKVLSLPADEVERVVLQVPRVVQRKRVTIYVPNIEATKAMRRRDAERKQADQIALAAKKAWGRAKGLIYV